MVSIKHEQTGQKKKREMAQKTRTENSIVVLFIAVLFPHAAQSTVPLTSGSPFLCPSARWKDRDPDVIF